MVWRALTARVLARAPLQVLTLVREIEVSHWGNIYVEESYIIVSRRSSVVISDR